MARRKKTPEISKITRAGTVAYARKQKPGEPVEGEGAGGEPDGAEASDAGLDAKFDVTDRSQPRLVIEDPEAAAPEAAAPEAAAPAPAAPEAAAPAPAAPASAAAPKPAASAAAAPAAPQPARPAPAAPPEEPAHTRADTANMPVVAKIGQPPAMPSTPAPAGISPRADAVEDPTNMPGPKEIPDGSPGDPAPAPGRVPPGDSRSLRRRDATTYEFALIYRRATFVITRFGLVGTRGQWRVVEYPTSAAASHAYAKECSRFVSEGFSDYRE